MTAKTTVLTWGRPDRTLDQSRTYRFARRYLLIAAAIVVVPILFLAPRDSLTLWLALSGVGFAGAFFLLQVMQSESLVSALFETSGVTLRRHDFTSTPEGKEEVEKIQWTQVKRLDYSNGMGEFPDHMVFMDYSSSTDTQVKTVLMKFESQRSAHDFLKTLGTRFGFERGSESGLANFDLQMSTTLPI